MTVTYAQQVATTNFGVFFKLLFRWKGSIYKLLWKDFVLFLIIYYMLRFLYRNILGEAQKRSYTTIIPFSFVLGFYMQVIFYRWLNMFNYIAWPDRMAMAVTANIKGLDERGRLLRRTIMRYLMVAYIMCQRSFCPRVKRRFPTMNHLTQAGLLTDQEEQIIENIPQNKVNKYVIPFLWTVNVISLARKEGRIHNDYAVSVLNEEMNQYRLGLGKVLRHDKNSIPLVYTQSVTLAVHMFVLFTLFGRQFLEMRQDGGEGDIDEYVHLGALLQFLLYMGWLKLAEMMINPFGDDDDDFDMNLLIDRNIQYSYFVVDDLHADVPPLVKDMYWNQKMFQLPYTAACPDETRGFNPAVGSADSVKVPENKSAFVPTSDGPVQPNRKFSSVAPKLPPTPEEPTEHSAIAPEAVDGHGKSTAIGRFKKSASGGLAYPKKFLETVEHQFHPDVGLVRVSDPFDNRFEEVDYKDPNQHLNAEEKEGDTKIQQDKAGDAKHGDSLLSRVSSSSSGAVRFLAQNVFRSNPDLERNGSTYDIVETIEPLNPNARRKSTPDYPSQVPPPPPPPPPPPEQHPHPSVTSWYLPQ